MRRSHFTRFTIAGLLALGITLSFTGIVVAAGLAAHHPGALVRGGDDGDLADQQSQYAFERTAPAFTLSGAALLNASQQAARLAPVGAPWQEVTTKPYNAQPSTYQDPFWGNQGSGFSIVGGRSTALAQTANGNWFAGTADGGVWRSTDQGKHWTPVFDSMPTLSIGALAVDPKGGALWVGTGEANVSSDSYAGTGVYSSISHGRSFQVVGGAKKGLSPLTSRTIFRIAFDASGNAYAATDNGLFRFSAKTSKWSEVLAPAGAIDNPPYDQQVTDVAIVPGSAGKGVIAAIGWHGPGNTQNNGFYQSTDGGLTFQKKTLTGDLSGSTDIGRTTFAYSADGTKLYAIVQSLSLLAAGAPSVLLGIYVASGAPASVAGPWTLIANSAKLVASGSGEGVAGSQAWYNEDLAVDPSNPNHVYAGLEEVYESTDGGSTWVTASPYWNYNFSCDSTNTCPNTTHPDQHAMMIVNKKIVIGNDGGVYSRPLSDTQQYGDWTDLNATLRSLQYYDARAGRLTSGLGIVGGLQDNGTSVLTSGSSEMSEAAGGDGFDVIVDPANANNMVGEYVDGTMYSSVDGGHTFSPYVSPTCASQSITGAPGGPRADCDPSARFWTPFVQDQQNAMVWVVGGRYVWVSTAGWGTTCTSSACSWTKAFDTGAGHAVTALSSANSGAVIYAAWVQGGNPGATFASGIATNFGGTWHQVSTAGLPHRFIAGITVDPKHPGHAYAILNGYSRRWIPGGGVGHVFETTNGGRTWKNISGNLPDVACNAAVLNDDHLALATDLGMYVAHTGQGTATKWSRLGTGLPNTSINNVTLGANDSLYVATHGRGIWREHF